MNVQPSKAEISLEDFRQVFDHLGEPIIITEANVEHPRIVYVNDALIDSLGYTQDELVGSTPRVFQGAKTDRNALDRIRTSLAAQEPVREVLVNYGRDGDKVVFELDIRPVFVENECVYFVAFQRDVTAQVRAQKELVDLRLMLESAEDIAKMGTWSFDFETERLTWSESTCAIFGLSPDEFDGTFEHFYSLVDPRDRPVLDEAHRRAQGQSPLIECEYRIRSADGQIRWIYERGALVRDEDGTPIRRAGMIMDIHETRRLREEAETLARRQTAILESITDAFFTLDSQWRFQYVNAEAERLLERQRDALLGASIWEEFPEATDLAFFEAYHRAVETSESVEFTEYFPPLSTWFKVTAYPSAEGLAVYFRDTTEEQEAIEALRSREERFRHLSNATHEAIFDWDLEEDTIWWNAGIEKLLKVRRSDVGNDPAIWNEYLHPDDLERALRVVRGAIEGDRSSWSLEYRLMPAGGETIHVLARGSIIRDESGRALRAIGGISDETDRVKAEAEIRELATLINKAQDAIIVRDANDCVIYWNESAERIYGYSRKEAMGRFVGELLYDDPRPFYKATAETIENGEWVGELKQRTRSGESIDVEGRWTHVHNAQGQTKSILAINTDITHSKRLEDQFLRAQRMETIGRLAGGIAHDLNNVLAPILMTVTMIREGIDDPDILDDLDTVESCVHRGSNMINQLLTFARGTEAERIPIDLSDIALDVERIVVETFPKSISFSVTRDPNLWLVYAVPTQMHQVITNLCINARDAMTYGGDMSLSLENVVVDEVYAEMNYDAAAGPYVLLTVHDTGTGMTPEQLDHIFEPFFTTKAVGEGTGIGLSTVHAIVKKHEGFIHVYSEPDKGSRFKIYLPADLDAEASEAAVIDESALPRGHGEVILVVDDEETIRDVARRTLERYGYSVCLAANGAEAVAIFARDPSKIDLVLTDMMMPIMDGPATIIALKCIDPGLTIIGSSGLSSSGQVAKAHDAGVKFFVPKPYTSETLLRTVAEALETRSETE